MLDYLDVSTVRLGDTSTRSITGIQGLVGLTQVRGTPFDRPENDGGVEPYDQFASSRTVTVQCEIWAETIADARADFGVVLRALEGMIHTDALLKFRWAGDVNDLQMTAKLTGSVLPSFSSEDGISGIVRYAPQFRCADPRAYSQTLQSSTTGPPTANGGMPYPIPYPIPFGVGATGGSVTVTNDGNTISWPDLFIAGPISGPVITVGSSSLTFSTLVLTAGQTLTIVTNPARRSMTVDGVNAAGSLRFADSVFAGLAPGVATNVSFQAIGGGTDVNTNLTVAWRDAWTA